MDRARKYYWLRYAKYLPNDLEHNHLLVDSSLFGVQGTARLLADIARERFLTGETARKEDRE